MYRDSITPFCSVFSQTSSIRGRKPISPENRGTPVASSIVPDQQFIDEYEERLTEPEVSISECQSVYEPNKDSLQSTPVTTATDALVAPEPTFGAKIRPGPVGPDKIPAVTFQDQMEPVAPPTPSPKISAVKRRWMIAYRDVCEQHGLKVSE